MNRLSEIDDAIRKKLTSSYTNFSSSISATKRARILMETKPLLNAHIKCREIWEALQLADYKKEGVLNDAALQVLLEKQGKNLYDLLQVKTWEDMIDLLDQDEDGFINEDEQILMFSIIKERMQNCANELCEIHEYNFFKELMKTIRIIETDIIKYQRSLRQRTHIKEMGIYQQIGQERKEEFEEEWELKFLECDAECEKRVQDLKNKHDQEMEQLNLEIAESLDVLKFKPKMLMKELQYREQIVAVNERYGEAQVIRNELKSFETSEINRVENLILSEQEKKRKKLLIVQKREMEHLLMKNSEAVNQLKIKKQKDLSRLEKEIKLHFHDIKKNQNQASRIAEKIGSYRDELRRTKFKSNRMKQLKKARDLKTRKKTARSLAASWSLPMILPNAKSTVKNLHGSTLSLSLGFKSATPLKVDLTSLTKFNIKSDPVATERPVNITPDFMTSTSFASKTGKLLQSKKPTNTLPLLSAHYSDSLERLSE